MADSDYMTNHSNFLGSNDIGKEIQLFDTNLDLASSETKNLSFKSVEKTSEETGSKELEKEVTKTVSGNTVPTTAVTGTITAGVVVATAVIFTSVLGNHFKMVDNSLSLTTYRDVETNRINLDYSFDLLYDRSGSVYVKLVSAAQSKTSEEYPIYYEEPIDEPQGDEHYEPVEGEEPPEVIEKDKEVFTFNISGCFTDLIEKNQYNFMVIEKIDNTESTLFSSRVYIPSYYVDVLDANTEMYKNEDGSYALSYNFFFRYEVETDLYAELKTLNKDGKYEVVQKTEKLHLLVDESGNNRQDEEGKFYSEFSGEFTNLVEYNEYILTLTSDAKGIINTPYSERLTAYVEHIPISYEIGEEDVHYELYKGNNRYLTAQIYVELHEFKGGYLQFEAVNLKTGAVSQSAPIEVTNFDASGVTSSDDHIRVTGELEIDDLTTDYALNIYSIIDIDTVLVYTGTLSTSQAFGYLQSTPYIKSLNKGGYMEHYIEFSLYSEFDGETYTLVKDSEGTSVISNTYILNGDKTSDLSLAFNELKNDEEYTYEIYGNWGNEDVLIDTGTFVTTYYGIEVQPADIIKNYEEHTISVTYSITDPNNFLRELECSISFKNDDGSNLLTFYGVGDSDSRRFDFTISQEIERGTIGELVITAIDSNNGDITTEFIKLAVLY